MLCSNSRWSSLNPLRLSLLLPYALPLIAARSSISLRCPIYPQKHPEEADSTHLKSK
jgi:hypothetical protein